MCASSTDFKWIRHQMIQQCLDAVTLCSVRCAVLLSWKHLETGCKRTIWQLWMCEGTLLWDFVFSYPTERETEPLSHQLRAWHTMRPVCPSLVPYFRVNRLQGCTAIPSSGLLLNSLYISALCSIYILIIFLKAQSDIFDKGRGDAGMLLQQSYGLHGSASRLWNIILPMLRGTATTHLPFCQPKLVLFFFFALCPFPTWGVDILYVLWIGTVVKGHVTWKKSQT